MGTIVAVYLGQLATQHLTGDDTLGTALAFSAESWNDGRYWTLLTYAWAHATSMFDDPGLFWLHLVANMIMLWFLGPIVEELLGHLRFLALYLGGVIVSALGWFCFFAQPGDAIIGASGAIFALIAAAGVLAPRVRISVLVFFVLPIRTTLGIAAVCICVAEVVQLIFGWLAEIAHGAHLSGAAFGCIFALVHRLISRRRLIIPDS